MSVVGYVRDSTIEGGQVLDRRLDALGRAGCECIFEDRAFGADPSRRQLFACFDYLRNSDVLDVLDVDGLSRRPAQLITLIDELEEKGIGFCVLNWPMDTTTPLGNALIQILAARAEIERNIIRHRIREGINPARGLGGKVDVHAS